jgi:hypothetical protein
LIHLRHKRLVQVLTGTVRKPVCHAGKHTIQTKIFAVDDDQIETLLSVRFHNITDSVPELQGSEASPSPSRMELDAKTGSAHGRSVEGRLACCIKESGGLVDCLCCLGTELSTFLVDLDPADADLVHHIWMTVREAGAKGVSKDQLFVSFRLSSLIIGFQAFPRTAGWCKWANRACTAPCPSHE